MDVFRMRCFVSVARHQNMSEAARELFLTRPAMTAQMNALEQEMGVTLLIRDKQKTQLTPAGRRTLETFESVLRELDRLEDEARSIDRNTKGRLHVGYHGPAEWEHLGGLFARYREAEPQVEVELAQQPWNFLVEKVENGSLDTAFVELSDARGASKLEQLALYDERLCVAASRENPLAAQESVSIAELAEQQVLLPNTAVGPRYFRELMKRLKDRGTVVRETGIGNIAEATIVLASAGYGVAVMPRSFKQPLESVAFVDLASDELVTHMGLVWRKDNQNPALPGFIDVCSAWDWS